MQIKVKGKIIDMYERVPFVNKETGESTPTSYCLQLLVEEKLSNGASKSELYDIKIDEKSIKSYEEKRGQSVELNCKIYSKSAISLTAV